MFFRIQYNYIIFSLSSLLPKPHLKLTSFSEANLFRKLTAPYSVFHCYSTAFYSIYKFLTVALCCQVTLQPESLVY